MAHFPIHSFQTFTLEKLPLQRDTWIMDEIYLNEWESAWLKTIAGDDHISPYQVGYVTPIHISKITPAGAEISWYPNIHDRFHEVKTFLPRKEFITAVIAHQFEKRATIFVKSDWLRKLHFRSNSIFAIIDAVDMTEAIRSGAISHEKVIALRAALDEVGARYPTISFISFADSLLLKTNWTAGMVDSDVKYTYAPEVLLILFQNLKSIYRETLDLEIYGVFAQGSNEYYDDPLLHISRTLNHISLNSLGLPFAQISLIEAAARKAIRAKQHSRMEIYMDEDLFHSLAFKDYKRKESWPFAYYKQKLSEEQGKYFYALCDELLLCLRMPVKIPKFDAASASQRSLSVRVRNRLKAVIAKLCRVIGRT